MRRVIAAVGGNLVEGPRLLLGTVPAEVLLPAAITTAARVAAARGRGRGSSHRLLL